MKKKTFPILMILIIIFVSFGCYDVNLEEFFFGSNEQDKQETQEAELPDTLYQAETPTTAPVPTTASVPPADQWSEVFAVKSLLYVDNGATAPEFTLPLQGPAVCTLTKILTYHWNYGDGVTPGTIGLQGSDGSYYGPYQASGEDGMGGVPNASWVVFVNIPIAQQVTYTVVDSDPGTWAQNSETGGVGMTTIWGVCGQ